MCTDICVMMCVCLFTERRRGRVKTGSPFSSSRLRSSTVLYHISGHLHSREKSKIKLNKVSSDTSNNRAGSNGMKDHSQVQHWKGEDYCCYWISVDNIRGQEAEGEYCIQMERGC